jgi:ribA/ribD-fused uncharacterized protein
MITTDKIDSFTGENRFLSNFHPCNMKYLGYEIPSNEHYYVLSKCDIHDKETIEKVSQMTAGQVKRFGRKKPLVHKSSHMRLHIMHRGLKQKFDPKLNIEMFQRLQFTGDALLVEGNTWGDTFWGVCDGKGLNYLGILLMNIRDSYK